MKISSLNIGRGLCSKIDVIEVYAKNNKIDVLGLSEVDIKPGDIIPDIPGYRCIVDDSKKKIRVLAYIKEAISVEKKSKNISMPSLFLDVGQITVGFVYNDFTEDSERVTGQNRRDRLLEMLEEFDGIAKQTSVLMGDMNIHWDCNSEERKILVNWAELSGYKQMVTAPTRTKSSSIIDLIFSRGKIGKSWITDPGISDHSAVECIVTKRRPKVEKSNRKVQITKVTPEEVKWARQNAPVFSSDDTLENLNNTLVKWMNKIREMCSREVEIKDSNGAPWYTGKLRDQKKMLAISTGEDKKRERNEYVRAVRKAKKEFIRNQMKKSKKSFWQIIKNKKSNDISRITIADGLEVKGQQIAQALADYFEEKPKNLQSTPAPDKIMKILETRQTRKEWDLKPINMEDLNKIIDNLKPKKSAGPDGVSYFFLKQFKFEVMPLLLQIINRSLETGDFLTDWKCGKVIPLYKGKGKRTDVGSYRPVTLTSTIGRVTEMVIRQQLEKHLEESGYLSTRQYGFRPGKSTEDCLTDCLNDIRKRLTDKRKVAICALDASSAFDVISRDLLSTLIRLNGAGPKMMCWLENYFQERTCYVEVNGDKSEKWRVNFGSVQGAPLSVTFYNIMSVTQTLFNDLSSSYGYADDGLEIVSANSGEECTIKVEEAACGIVDWFKEIGLALNKSKSEVMSFGYNAPPIEIAGQTVVPKASIKFLGLRIQTNLKWEEHVDYLCVEIRKCAGRIRHEGRFLKLEERIKLYRAWVNGRIYSNARAYIMSLTIGDMDKLQGACNVAIRAVGRVPRFSEDSVSNLRQKLGIESVKEIRSYYEYMEAWRYRNDLNVENVGRRSTRLVTENKVVAPDVRGFRKDLNHTIAAIAWNHLPPEIREINDKDSAKSAVKTFIGMTAGRYH